jgi:hypothetical protein
MTNFFAFLTAKNEENLQAPLFEELDDSQASAVTGGVSIGAQIGVDDDREASVYFDFVIGAMQ